MFLIEERADDEPFISKEEFWPSQVKSLKRDFSMESRS